MRGVPVVDTFTVPWTDGSGAARVSGPVTLTEPGDPALPTVLLLHGFGGTVEDMTDPAVHPGWNHDLTAPVPVVVDHGWHDLPAFGIAGVELDPTLAVTSWQEALEAAGFGTVAWGQVDATGLLGDPVRETSAVVAEVLARVPPDRSLAVVAHSRGGLLARAWLQEVAGDPAVLDRVLVSVTLHAPHLGTEVASMASGVAHVVSTLTAVNPALAAPLAELQALVSAPAYGELAVGSPFITGLEGAETAGPVVPTHAWSGTSPRMSRVRVRVWTASSAVPQLVSLLPLRIQFRWRAVAVPLPDLVTGYPLLGLLAGELRDGEGDVLVTETRAHLDGEQSHTTHHVHHFEALWHPDVHAEVVQVLTDAASA